MNLNREMVDENRIDYNDSYRLLQWLYKNGKLEASELSRAQEQTKLEKRKEILNLHKYKIWKGKDGKWYTHLPDGKGGRTLKKRSSRESLEDAIIEYYLTDMRDLTIREVFDEAMDRRLAIRKIDSSTLERYTQDFNRYYKEFGERKIKSVSLKEFSNFLQDQIPKHDLTAKAFTNLKTITGHLINYAFEEELISYSRDELYRKVQTSDRQFKCPVIEDEKEVFGVFDTDIMRQYLLEHQDIWNLGILLMFVAGLRVGELVALKWSNISDGIISVRATETRHKVDGRYHYDVKDRPKTKAGIREVPVPKDYQWIFDAIRKCNDDEEFLFVRNGKRLTTNCIRDRLRRVNKKIELMQRSPNKIRKTYCSILVENKVDDLTVTKLMGHTDIACAKGHYIRDRYGLESRIETVNTIPNFSIQNSES